MGTSASQQAGPSTRRAGRKSLATAPVGDDHQRMTKHVFAEDLKVGDVIHLRTMHGMKHIELTEIIRRTQGFKLVGYQVGDRYRIRWATFNTGIQFGETAEIDERD